TGTPNRGSFAKFAIVSLSGLSPSQLIQWRSRSSRSWREARAGTTGRGYPPRAARPSGREAHGHRRSLPLLALERHLRAVGVGVPLDEREPEAHPAGRPRLLAAAAGEGLE